MTTWTVVAPAADSWLAPSSGAASWAVISNQSQAWPAFTPGSTIRARLLLEDNSSVLLLEDGVTAFSLENPTWDELSNGSSIWTVAA